MVSSDSSPTWFPPSWRSLLQSLKSHPGLDPRMLEHLLRRFCNPRSGTGNSIPDWYSLLRALTNREPVLDDAGIHTRPRFVLLPFHVQRSLLSLLENHKAELPVSMLQRFVGSIQGQLADDWSKLYLHLLHIHVLHAYSSRSQQILHTGFISLGSSQMLENLCQEVKTDNHAGHDQGAQFWQVNPDWLFKDVNVSPKMGNSDWLDSITQPDMTEAQPSRKRKITDGVEEVLNDAPGISSGKRLKLDATIEDMFPTEDVEFENEVIKNTETLLESKDVLEGIGKPPATDLWKDKFEATFAPLQEALQSSRGSLSPSETDLLRTLVTLPLPEVHAVSEGLSLDSLEQNSLAAVCQQLVAMPTNFISFTTTKVLACCLFSKKITELQQTAPRNLLVTMCQFAQTYPKALLDGPLIPHIQEGSLGANQVDLILKIAKESLDNDGRLPLLRALLLAKHLEWSDHITVFVQGIISTKITLSSDILDELLTFLEVHHATQSKCPKFTRLLVAIVNKTQKQLTAGHKAVIQGIIESNQTFLKKTLVAALRRCR